MTPDALDTTNIWLAIIALVALAEFLAFAVAGFLAFRLYQRATTVLDEIEQKHVAPLSARVTAILDDVKGIAVRVHGIENQVSEAIHRVDESAERTVATVRARMWPLIGLARGMRAAITAATSDNRAHGDSTSDGFALGK